MDCDIEESVKSCRFCALAAKSPLVKFQPWPKTDSSWIRLHIDFSGPLNGAYYLIVVDSYTKFYWFIHVGALIAYSCVALVQQNISFEIGYLIPFLSMLFAMVALVSGRNIYRHSYPAGSALLQSAKIIREGIKRHKLVKNQARSQGRKISSLDAAKKENGGSFDAETVDGVLSSLKVLPVFIAIIFYWAIYSQMSSTYFLQGTVMDISINGAPMSVAVLNVFNVVIVLILIPILDFVYKYLQKIGKNPTPLQRMGFGLVLTALSVAVAGIVEIFRVKELRAHGGVVQLLANKPYNASHVSIFAQIPQFALIGFGEVFTSIAVLSQQLSQYSVYFFFLRFGICIFPSTGKFERIGHGNLPVH
ncbi:solute carrier family 15 member 4-like [Octopus sinensis]|uniref:Solute carrier family 15 member 4-like n=1 Tax=Octopus sinensis TaxID=2607531 RepID=A0A7E6EZY9_9MOLL|nr:solute carrier family 15 member 4-like [Octopus sinensis]